MNAGRERDALVAEKVMEWDVGDIFYDETHQEIMPRVPRYSTSIADAWPVHEQSCTWLFSKRRLYLDSLLGVIRQDIKQSVVWPDALIFLKPHHICLAALKAMGYKERTDETD